MEIGKGGKPNRLAGECIDCGEIVEAGEGVLAGKSAGVWQVSHVGQCPGGAVVHAQWMHYARGLGGAARVGGVPPDGAELHEWVPLNQPARDLHERMPRPARRTHDEHRAVILARFGHTDASWNHGRPIETED